MDKIISWNKEKFTVGIDEIDRQHKGLFDILNQLYSSYQEDKVDNLSIRRTLYKLIDYMFKHFQSEEILLKKYDYPEFKSHREQHQQFKKNIQEKYDYFLSHTEHENISSIPIDLIMYLSEWIGKHILKFDKEYSEYFKKNDFFQIENN